MKHYSVESAYNSIYESKGYEDHEVSMIRAQLHSIQKSCESLMKSMSGEEANVEAWVQAKITTAEEDLHAAANYIESGESEVK
jgi:peptidoglycan hydrolase CwlO-like protein